MYLKNTMSSWEKYLSWLKLFKFKRSVEDIIFCPSVHFYFYLCPFLSFLSLSPSLSPCVKWTLSSVSPVFSSAHISYTLCMVTWLLTAMLIHLRKKKKKKNTSASEMCKLMPCPVTRDVSLCLCVRVSEFVHLCEHTRWTGNIFVYEYCYVQERWIRELIHLFTLSQIT